ncbi:uncharacterized protein FOMMEDRAFT_24889 [Fomitiporia mediterranea MF3/22]|uniref:uncharacterized protein n=1 Tax=Fomitiporia mediterranea (strain MF3/22) TaxID=694068 RepID=UPI0004407985|nr:uncharacterized protein FOMMEDRAFT_24889 [Fomitiporia mediterranea MF3/22]EJD07545.1 hypothetical protein FOMMEDRAFT_24889 [Fomitiporia mediterranea MF3/22]
MLLAIVVIIPKSAILSIRNCLLAEHIPQVIFGTEAQLGLALGLFGEILRGHSSPWSSYLQSLPKLVNIALFWDENNEDEKVALKWIEGTMAEVERSTHTLLTASGLHNKFKRTQTDLLSYYEFTALPALAKVKLDENATLEGFQHAFALVSSRSFIVDAYHGLAMVPIADAFNHSSENHVHLESDHEVCRVCGSLKQCPHDIEDEGSDESVTLLKDQGLNDLNDLENTCEMVTNDFVPPFSEVFNTYGEHLTNAQLLVRYGFILDINENDVLLWNARQLCSFMDSFVSRSSRGSEICSDEQPASKDRDRRRYDIFVEQTLKTAGRVGERERQRAPGSRFSDGKTVSRTENTDPGDDDPVTGVDQVILERLQEVVELYAPGDTILSDSDLVFFPNARDGTRHNDFDRGDANLTLQNRPALEARSCNSDGNLEACRRSFDIHKQSNDLLQNRSAQPDGYKTRNGRTILTAAPAVLSLGWPVAWNYQTFRLGQQILLQNARRIKNGHQPLYFVLDSEAKISHHLWLFCVLFALHEERLRSACTDVDSDPQSRMEYIQHLPRRDGAERCATLETTFSYSSQNEWRHAGKTPAEYDSKQIRLMTSVEEDLALLWSIACVQNKLGHLGSEINAGIGLQHFSRVGRIHSWVPSSEDSAMKIEQASRVTLPNLIAEDLSSSSSPLASSLLDRNPIQFGIGLQKRLCPEAVRCTEERYILAECQNAQDQGLPTSVLPARIRIRRSGHDGDVKNHTDTEEQEEAVKDTHENTSNVSFETKLGQFREPFHVESQQDRRQGVALLSSLLCDYGAASDAESDDATHAYNSPYAQPSSAVDGGCQAENQGEECPTSQERGQISEQLANCPEKETDMSGFRDRHAEAGSKRSISDLATAADAKLQNDPKERDTDSAFCDASVVQLIASTARVVSALCETRYRGMAHSNLSVAELGEVVDAIPPEMTQARMAAQLALSERTRLEACIAAWHEISPAVSRMGLSELAPKK